MDYEKKYKNALEWARQVMNGETGFIRKEVEEVFPELKESEDEKTKKEIINYLECQSRDEPTRKDIHDKWISYIKKHALSKDDYDFLRNCARVLKIFGYQPYADRLTGLCPTLEEEAKAMMATPIIFDESKDEKIRKDIIWCLKHSGIKESSPINPHVTTIIKDAIAWLEKQGEQKPTYKVEPKFHEGDWVVDEDDNCIHQIERVIENVTNNKISYDLVGGGYFPSTKKNYHLWTIQDAKDGDVLCSKSGWTCIFRALDNHTNTFSSYCFMDSDKWFCNTGCTCHTLDEQFIRAYNFKLHPATKEQRDTLLKAMADAGYTFDFEKKELKKIEHKPAMIQWKGNNLKEVIDFTGIYKDGFEKWFHNSWEEYEKYVHEHNNIFKIFNKDGSHIEVPVGAWIVKTPDGYNTASRYVFKQKPALSEEDVKAFNRISAILVDASEVKNWWKEYRLIEKDEMIRLTEFLKSLKGRYTWKPSDEQMKILNEVLNFAANHESPHWNDYIFGTLNNLIRQLKKLREE